MTTGTQACERSQSRAAGSLPCALCGAVYSPKHPRGRYCSDAHRAKAGRERKERLYQQALSLPFHREPVWDCRQIGATADVSPDASGRSQITTTADVLTQAIPAASSQAVADEKGRFKGQAVRILDRLRQGPATNRELAGIALKYTGRVSELRDAGHRIEVRFRDRSHGLTEYALLDPAQRELEAVDA